MISNTESTIKFIEENWTDKEALRSLIGTKGANQIHNWGFIPTNKATIDAVNGKIVRIRTYDGMSWSRLAYGQPVVDTCPLPSWFADEIEKYLTHMTQYFNDPQAWSMGAGQVELRSPSGEWCRMELGSNIWWYGNLTSGVSAKSLKSAIAQDQLQHEINLQENQRSNELLA